MARRNDHNLEEIKGLILSAAEEIVIEQGYDALTVRKIAMRIGYTVGSIYMVFENMADVVSHLNTKTVVSITRQLQSVPEADLPKLVRAYLAYIVNNYQFWRLLSATQLTINNRNSKDYIDAVDKLVVLIALHLPKSTTNLAQQKCTAMTFWASMQGISAVFLPEEQKIGSANAAEESLELLAKLFTEKT